MHEPAESACQAPNPVALERLLQGWRMLTMLISHDLALELEILGGERLAGKDFPLGTRG